MMGFLKKHKGFALAFTGLAVLILIVISSDAFQNCVCKSQNEQGEQLLSKTLAQLRLFFLHCPGMFLHDNGPAIEALSTVAIAILAYFTWRATRQQSDSTDKLSAATLGLERPYLFVERVKIDRRGHSLSEHNAWFISFSIKNVGRAPAWIEECRLGLMDKDILPKEPDYDKAPTSPIPQTLAPNRSFWTHEFGPAPPIEKDGKPIEFVVFGKITYRDLMGNVHKTGFAAHVSPHMPVSSIWPDKPYNYYD